MTIKEMCTLGMDPGPEKKNLNKVHYWYNLQYLNKFCRLDTNIPILIS